MSGSFHKLIKYSSYFQVMMFMDKPTNTEALYRRRPQGEEYYHSTWIAYTSYYAIITMIIIIIIMTH